MRLRLTARGSGTAICIVGHSVSDRRPFGIERQIGIAGILPAGSVISARAGGIGIPSIEGVTGACGLGT